MRALEPTTIIAAGVRESSEKPAYEQLWEDMWTLGPEAYCACSPSEYTCAGVTREQNLERDPVTEWYAYMRDHDLIDGI